MPFAALLVGNTPERPATGKWAISVVDHHADRHANVNLVQAGRSGANGGHGRCRFRSAGRRAAPAPVLSVRLPARRPSGCVSTLDWALTPPPVQAEEKLVNGHPGEREPRDLSLPPSRHPRQGGIGACEVERVEHHGVEALIERLR
jgi:hypothetical protein